jgi:hypothetical protein
MEVGLVDMLTIEEVASALKLNGDFRAGRRTNVPWREDIHPSLVVWKCGMGYCDYARRGETGWAGDAVMFYAMATGRTYKDSFALLAGKHKDLKPEHLAYKPRDTPKPSRPRPPDLDEYQLRLMTQVCADGWKSELLPIMATQRDYQLSTLQAACLDGILGVVEFPKFDRPSSGSDGIDWPKSRALCFVYGWGVKCRWRTSGERRIKWLWNYGLTKATLWNGPARGGKLEPVKEHNIFMTEGETDALRMMELDAAGGLNLGRVIAIPNASYLIPDWELTMLSGKDVTLGFDYDHAGCSAATRIASQLERVRCKVRRLQLPDGLDIDEAFKAGKLSL